ncbi:MAG: TolC family protein, partial [Phycisphaerae bacterium]
AAEQAVAAAAARLQEQYRLIFPNVEIGVAFERGARQQQGGRKLLADTARASIAGGALTAPDIEPRSERQRNQRTDFVIGPSIGLELPIFDQNQAQIAKARFAYERAMKALEALDLAATQQIRGAVDRARTSWRIIRLYRDHTLPLAKDNLDLSRKSYQAGKTSFLSVIEAQRFFLDSRKRFVAASRDAAVTIPEMERSIGLPFDRLMSTPSMEPETSTQDAEQEESAEP